MSRRKKSRYNQQQHQQQAKGQSMNKVVKASDELVEEKEVEGLLSAKFKHKIQSTEATLEYSGPKISPAVWHQILSFFRWTYDTTKGESQVRLYVNVNTREWGAWAYPQEARAGMTSRELVNEEFKRQRASHFLDSEGWAAFGTVHHHCSCSAFQSGVDESDERSVPGLHITVGNVDANVHSLDCRFYLRNCKFNPDMSQFWEIGNIMTQIPAPIMRVLPEGSMDKIAREQMCEKIEVPFPDQWRANMIEIRSHVVSPIVHSGSHEFHNPRVSTGYTGFGGNSTYGVPRNKRIERAAEEALRGMAHSIDFNESEEAYESVLTFLDESVVVREILVNCNLQDVFISEVVDQLIDMHERGHDMQYFVGSGPKQLPLNNNGKGTTTTQAGAVAAEGAKEDGVDPQDNWDSYCQ